MEGLYLKMEGNAFVNGYRLDKMVSGLSGTQQVLEGIYKGVSGKNRLSKTDREHYKLVAYEVKQGSLLVTIGAVFSGVQQVLPFLPSTSPEAMWEYTKETTKFLYEIYKAAHEGKTIKINQEEDNTVVINEGDGNTINVYHAPVYQIGQQIITGLRNLDDCLEEYNVTKIKLGANNESIPAIVMSFEEKGLYHPPIKVDKEPKVIRCDIFDFNKYDKEGRLKVLSNQSIPDGKYKFRVVGRQDIEEYIISMTETEVEINCLLEIEHDPLKETKIGDLLIIDIAA